MKGKFKKNKGGPLDYKSVVKRITDVNEFPPECIVVLYGRAGTGKTTLAATFPKPVLILDFSEKGTDSVRSIPGIKAIRIESWDEVEQIYWYLKKNPGAFKTVVWDTVSQAQDHRIRRILMDHKKSDQEVGGWGTMTKREWGAVSSGLKEWIFNYRDGLNGMNVVFIAHDGVFTGNDNDEESEDEGVIMPEVGPRVMPSVSSSLNAAASIIGNTFIRERYKTVLVGKKKKEKREVQYCLRIGPHSIYTTKIRKPKSVLLPDVIEDPDFNKLMSIVKGQVTNGKEDKGVKGKKVLLRRKG